MICFCLSGANQSTSYCIPISIFSLDIIFIYILNTIFLFTTEQLLDITDLLDMSLLSEPDSNSVSTCLEGEQTLQQTASHQTSASTSTSVQQSTGHTAQNYRYVYVNKGGGVGLVERRGRVTAQKLIMHPLILYRFSSFVDLITQVIAAINY